MIRTLLLAFTWISFLACAPAGAQSEQPPLLMVDNFDDGIQNRLGGYYNSFESAPSSAATLVVSNTRRGEGGRSLRIRANRQEEGFCGFWLQFFNFRDPNHGYLDSRSYQYLSFWIRGEQGGENFAVKLADRRWIEAEDSVYVGYIDEFLPGGVTQQWQEVLVPLAQAGSLDLRNLGGVTFDFTEPGQYTIYIDDVCFKTASDVATPTSPKGDLSVVTKKYPKAMWVWSTDALLDDAKARRKLFEFSKRHGVGELWVQLLYEFSPELDLANPPAPDQPPPATRCLIHKQKACRQFLRQAHAAGIQVHALDGYPEYAIKDFHHAPLAVVDAVIEFNQKAPPQERFDGVHFDNEPYLTIGWQDPVQRQAILRDFLDLNAECQRRVRQRSSMQYGVDIPFWWQKKDGETGRYLGEVTYQNRTTAVSYFLIEMLDNLGIMNYRDEAGGADGMIAHGQDLLEYSEKVGGAGIYMGIETFAYEPTEVWFAVGLPRARFSEAVRTTAGDLARFSRLRGQRIRTFDDGLNIHVGVEIPPQPAETQFEEIRSVLVELAQRLGIFSMTDIAQKKSDLAKDAEFAIIADVEWDDFAAKDIRDPSNDKVYPGFKATTIMLPKITFADNTYDDLKAETESGEEFFAKFRCYRGFAIHHYETFRALIPRGKDPCCP